MKYLTQNRSLLAVVLITIVAGMTWSVYGQKTRTVAVKWEYKEVWENSIKNVNDLGSEGWEVVNVALFEGGNRFYLLKRAK